ncbi:MAG: hypothetical protein OEZ32_08125 [Nitrospinota bacterium]|nr:hypothetical protein [Nitrospinota bacterium]
MAVAKDIIEAALRQIGVARRGMKLDAADIQEGLAALNRMVDSWALEEFMIYAVSQGNFTLTGGKSEYTIGSGGDFAATRPEDVLSAWIRDSAGIDHPVSTISRDRYNAICSKNSPGRPTELYFDPQYPLAKLMLWPTPSAVEDLYLDQLVKVPSFADENTSVSLPPGYEECLVCNLAVRLAPEYGITPPDEVRNQALQIKGRITNHNFKPGMFQHDIGLLSLGSHGGSFNIYSG